MQHNIESHTRQLAQQLLRDTEQTSLLRLNTWLLVARRLAKVTEEHEIYAWLGAELGGYDQPNDDPVQKKYAYLTGRLLDRETGNGDWRPVAEIEADTDCTYRRNIAARLQSLVHDFATDIYYRLEFGNQTENTFQFQRSAIDMELATYLGNSLNSIPVLYDRLTKHDKSAVQPVVEACRQMVDTFSVVATQRGKRRLGVGASRELSADLSMEDKCERVEQFVSSHCKEPSRVERLIQSFQRLLQYLATTSIHAIAPAEAKYLVLHTYILLAEIFSLKNRQSR